MVGMSFWLGPISTSESARRIVRYCGIGWIALACLNTLVLVLDGIYVGIFLTIFSIAAARACFEHSRTATTMVFGVLLFCAAVNILGVLMGGLGSGWLDALAVFTWLLVVLSAFRVVKAVKFLNDEDVREAAENPSPG
jgi:hypothetical protein